MNSIGNISPPNASYIFFSPPFTSVSQSFSVQGTVKKKHADQPIVGGSVFLFQVGKLYLITFLYVFFFFYFGDQTDDLE